MGDYSVLLTENEKMSQKLENSGKCKEKECLVAVFHSSKQDRELPLLAKCYHDVVFTKLPA